MNARAFRSGFVGTALLSLGAVAVGLSRTNNGTRLTVPANHPALVSVGNEMHYQGLKFTGDVVEYYGAGMLKSSRSYEHGMLDGIMRGWHVGGTASYYREFADGRETGIHVGWWEDGTVRFRYEFRDGKHHGNARQWYEDGQLYRDFNYEDGQEVGHQRMWNADGSVRANYVVKSGRRYGLVGSKGCVGEARETEVSL